MCWPLVLPRSWPLVSLCLPRQGFSTASNGFPGYSPASEGCWDRSNYAVYTE